jgi:hypothetical protein
MSTEENNQFNLGSENFGLPGDYFERSAASIVNKIEWTEEHKAYPHLLALRNKKVFALPSGYFAGSASRLELLDFPVLLALPKQQTFKTPSNYFDTAEVSVLSKAMREETDELAAFSRLHSIRKQNPFSVDETYFTVNEKLLTTLLEPDHKPARIIDLFFSRTSYVAAALLMIGLGLWLYSIYVRPVQQQQDCGTMACVDKTDLLKARNLEGLDNDELYELVNPKELEKKLETGSQGPVNSRQTDSSARDGAMDELIEEI